VGKDLLKRNHCAEFAFCEVYVLRDTLLVEIDDESPSGNLLKLKMEIKIQFF